MTRTDELRQIIIGQSGKLCFVQKVAFTNTPAATALAATTTAAQGSLPVTAGAKLCLIADQDFWYQMISSAATTSVGKLADTQVGVFVPKNTKEYLFLGGASQLGVDAKLDIVRDSADGTVAIHLVT